ncbi:hypothetical protein JTE90_000501 [Oedothorax gibbosus]|uniref:DNA polymerase epsilon subunit 3 n=1 Tax=Oedothorax gibbosus TaxID=931172 RepID=A0AAV6VXD1_9ARAC|nr:hypothetical protein JTE90_000501 [Oedothorax gibbosus]
MAQKVEDFNLPLTAITKIVKEAIPEGVKVTEAAKAALNKAASVFVLYATSSANSLSQDANRKRLLAKDIFDALDDLDLDFLIPPLHNSLKEFRKSVENKKQAKVSKRASNPVEEPEEEEEEEDDEDEQQPNNQGAAPQVAPQQAPFEVIEIDSDEEEG